MTAIVFRMNRNYKKIPLSNVYYIATHPTKPHKLRMVTNIGIMDFFDNLNKLEKRYSGHLVRCHRSCLVNITKIREFDFSERTLILESPDEMRVPFSRRRQQQLLQSWLEEEGEMR